jgi:hypothetical protein
MPDDIGGESLAQAFQPSLGREGKDKRRASHFPLSYMPPAMQRLWRLLLISRFSRPARADHGAPGHCWRRGAAIAGEAKGNGDVS